MEPNPQESVYTESSVQEHKVDVNVEQPGAIAPFSSSKPTSDQPLQELLQPVLDSLSKLPGIISGFYYEYQSVLILIGLVVGGGISVYLTLAILDAINDIPLLAPIFELVGVGYTIWFIARYLWKAESRKELGEEFNSLKDQLLGKES
ncbi:CAAD domain-containing protein [Limnofasciculus baicalensis]|uniref:CAAD domain-containing protein n=1 Tax=Limnofasciculus baicalensis BBK-W-15 TaxID=2699891 RepID=A0AAE3KQL0_9CYAN|nr:CAAD domain-containing protein [Limnofasciculus baicalensis]MCP2730798.1 CAAD domain-containing protein [Limnofasciculus baicalensis BBK-W-15]